MWLDWDERLYTSLAMAPWIRKAEHWVVLVRVDVGE